MTRVPPPLRFLALLVGGWMCVRVAILAPDWDRPAPALPSGPGAEPVRQSIAALPRPLISSPPTRAEYEQPSRGQYRARTLPLVESAPAMQSADAPFRATVPRQFLQDAIFGPSVKRASRWSGSAWAFVRDGGANALAPGGTLGGSQAGARLRYRLNGDEGAPISLSARVYAPFDQADGAEAALGIDWRPVARLDLHLLAERRQRLGSAGRSAMSLTVYGGHSGHVGPLALDFYGQAGVVGLRARDLFADGSVKAGLAAAKAKIGAGLWAAAQPGVWRVDIGPQASYRLPGSVIVAADWRLRIAGDARPASGPSLTLSAGF